MEAEICPNCEKVVYDAEGFPAGNVILMSKIDFFLRFPINQLRKSYERKKYYTLHTLHTYFLMLTQFFFNLLSKIISNLQNSFRYLSNFFLTGGRRFHKRCFKCIFCSKKLDSNNVRVSGSKLYCKVCLDKIAPPEAPKIYADTTKLAPSDEKGCPR